MSFTPHLLVFETLPTTMLEAKSRARAGALEGTTVVARAQTSGRGRLGREWLAEANSGIWMTTILRPPLERQRHFAELSLVAGIAVCETLRGFGVTGAVLKWPNDVLVGDRKLAGILLENDGPLVLVGIGVNLTASADRQLPKEIATRYTGVYDHVAPEALINEVHSEPLMAGVRTLLACLATWYDLWKREGFAPLMTAYDRFDALKGSSVRVTMTDGVGITGTARGVNALGELEVETASGVSTVRAGEVERVRQ